MGTPLSHAATREDGRFANVLTVDEDIRVIERSIVKATVQAEAATSVRN